MLWYLGEESTLDLVKRLVLCIDPDSDSDIAIEEGETDFKT